MRTARQTRTRLGVLAAGAALLLTGCGTIHPGTAALVGDTRITHDEVDRVAEALCAVNLASAQVGGPQSVTAIRGAREAALQILIESELSQQFGERRGVEADPARLAAEMQASANTLGMLDDEDERVFSRALRDYVEGQLILIEVGRETGGEDLQDNEAIARANQQRAGFVRGLDVEVDPRYGQFVNGALRRGGTELSVAASDKARQGLRARPTEGFVADLPPTQQCR